MTPHLWAIDTPWNNKGEEYRDVRLTIGIGQFRGGLLTELTESQLVQLGWIKPVEEKKLTEEEILEAITVDCWVGGNLMVSAGKLTKFLAEHLK